jgi:hypothetical protein
MKRPPGTDPAAFSVFSTAFRLDPSGPLHPHASILDMKQTLLTNGSLSIGTGTRRHAIERLHGPDAWLPIGKLLA